jgi:hypothetical protein
MPDQSMPADAGDGRLVPLLLAMTIVTGVVDAVSILRLGHVFVANMTGNVVFLGFALAGGPGFSVSASLVALAAFLCGAAIGGRTFPSTVPRLTAIGWVAGGEAALCGAATVVALLGHGRRTRMFAVDCWLSRPCSWAPWAEACW